VDGPDLYKTFRYRKDGWIKVVLKLCARPATASLPE
jgi:hypothetical protein